MALIDNLRRLVVASGRSPSLSPRGGERAVSPRWSQSLVFGLAAIVLFGCSEASGTAAGAGEDAGLVAPHRCLPAEGTTGSPRTIYEALDLVNGLPHPVQLSCFLESLDRPLALVATWNTSSAQPALSKQSPRTFIVFNESLSASFVPGAAAATLEFGERDASRLNSLKAEIHFPIEAPLTPVDAFSRLSPDSSTGLTLDKATKCGSCHNAETPTTAYPYRGAFMSFIIKPTAFFNVEIESLRHEREICDFASEPERCGVLEAIFDYGVVTQTQFP